MISNAELLAMQADANDGLPDSGTIYRPTRTSNGMGGGSVTWTAVGTADCRIRPAGMISPEERETAGKVTTYNEWTITMPAGTDIAPADRVQSLSRTWEVVAHQSASWDISRRVRAVEVT